MTNFTREPIEFRSNGILLRGEIFLPPSTGPLPAVLLAHGWGMTAEGNLTDFAAAFAARGIAALTIDFRNLGRSEGEIRQDINPFEQIEDLKNALTYLSTRNEVDPDRMGIWGSSFSGGHVLVVAATDRRVKCVVSQVPTIHGPRAARMRLSAAQIEQQRKRFNADRVRVMNGAAPGVVTTVSADPKEAVLYRGSDSFTYMHGDSLRAPSWRNFCTLRSLESAWSYIPGAYVPEISPTPLLMIVAADDIVCPTDLQIDAFEAAAGPKHLCVVPGGHYAPYIEQFEKSSVAATDWFLKHL